MKYILISIIIFLFSCNIDEKDTKQKSSISVIDISTYQLEIMNNYYEHESCDSILIDSIYSKYPNLWKGYIGSEENFIDWIHNTAYDELEIYNKKQKELNFEKLEIELENTAKKMTSFTGKQTSGTWYIFYGPKWMNLGGFANGTMLIDLAHDDNDSFKNISFYFAHELNHQIYAKTRKKTNTHVLDRIIDEGFACFVSHLYHDSKTSIHEELVYTIDEYKYCQNNEEKIIQLLKDNYLSQDKEVSKKFASRSCKFQNEMPTAIGYYIGFRIIQEYVKQNGENSWKNIYTLSSLDVLEKSKFIK